MGIPYGEEVPQNRKLFNGLALYVPGCYLNYSRSGGLVGRIGFGPLPELHRIATVVGALWPSDLLLAGSGQLLGTIQSRFSVIQHWTSNASGGPSEEWPMS